MQKSDSWNNSMVKSLELNFHHKLQDLHKTHQALVKSTDKTAVPQHQHMDQVVLALINSWCRQEHQSLKEKSN
jgi:predicted DNA-binding transcriptional regulator YafY